MDSVINTTCPWSGEPVREDSPTAYRGHTVGFCNPGCRDKFERAVEMFEALLAARPSETDRSAL